jgi:hypothetical protein
MLKLSLKSLFTASVAGLLSVPLSGLLMNSVSWRQNSISIEPSRYLVARAAACVASDNLGEVATYFIGRCRKASIREVFPGEFLNETLGNIQAGSTAKHKTAWKLLNDGRFAK